MRYVQYYAGKALAAITTHDPYATPKEADRLATLAYATAVALCMLVRRHPDDEVLNTSVVPLDPNRFDIGD